MALTRDSYINDWPLEVEQELTEFFGKKSQIVIFDIGSCEGEDSIKYSRLFPNAKIYAVEALPSNLPLLQKTLEKYSNGNIEVIPIALSDQKGTATFYVSSGHPDHLPVTDWDYGNKSSSLLPPDQTKEVHPWLKFNQEVAVETDTLHQVCRDRNIDCIDFVHLDVQGAELKVLQGAGDLLQRVKLIWMEVEAVTLYKDQPVRSDVEAFMHQHGFIKLKDTVNDVAGDQLYVNPKYLPQLRLQKLLSRLRTQVKGTIKPLVPVSVRQYLRQLLSPTPTLQSVLPSSVDEQPILAEQPVSPPPSYHKISYSQCGEDLIIQHIFEALKIDKPSYLDVGAHHPFFLSNTALFYSKGSRGVNIEPDPNLFQAFVTARPDDINLNIGISAVSGEMDFYHMAAPTLNTLVQSQAERYQDNAGYAIESVTKVKVETIEHVITHYCNGKFPDLLSVDAEGMDLEILQSIDYEKSTPTVICVETISFSETGNGVKDNVLIEFLKARNYMVYADTNINTIFVLKSRWKR